MAYTDSAQRFTTNRVSLTGADHMRRMTDSYRQIARDIDGTVLDGRLKSLALTELESSFNWIMRAIAETHGEPVEIK